MGGFRRPPIRWADAPFTAEKGTLRDRAPPFQPEDMLKAICILFFWRRPPVIHLGRQCVRGEVASRGAAVACVIGRVLIQFTSDMRQNRPPATGWQETQSLFLGGTRHLERRNPAIRGHLAYLQPSLKLTQGRSKGAPLKNHRMERRRASRRGETPLSRGGFCGLIWLCLF